MSPRFRSAVAQCAGGAPTEFADGWTITPSEAVGLNPGELREAVEWLNSLSRANVHSILVVRRGALVFEYLSRRRG
jgi:hypothetical protein